MRALLRALGVALLLACVSLARAGQESSTIPGFQAVGPWSGEGPAPVYVTLSLNINDFTRPDREAAAVRRFLDATAARGMGPVELSFTGMVLDALAAADLALIARIRREQPGIRLHYRLLQYRRLRGPERELYATDPVTNALDRSRPGPLVSVQRTFGVTPLSGGGGYGDALRATWAAGAASAALRAAGVREVSKDALLFHPDTLVGTALFRGGFTDGRGHSAVDAVTDALALGRRAAAGQAPGAGEAAGRSLVHLAQLAAGQGWDLRAVPALAGLLDHTRIPAFYAGLDRLRPDPADAAALRSPEAVRGAAAALWALVDQRPTMADDVAARLARLDHRTVYVARLSWHASNDYTVGSWSEHLVGPHATMASAGTRPAAQQAAIAAAFDGVLDALAESGRVQVISLDRDAQWAPANSPEAGWPAVYGVGFDRVLAVGPGL